MSDNVEGFRGYGIKFMSDNVEGFSSYMDEQLNGFVIILIMHYTF